MFIDDPGAGRPSMRDHLVMALTRARKKTDPTPYARPGQNEQAFLGGMDPNMLAALGGRDKALQSERSRYAEQQLGKYGKAADMLGGSFNEAFDSQDMSDPIAAFKALSGLFTQTSRDQGVDDPRVLLRQLLAEFQGAQAPAGGGRKLAAANPHTFDAPDGYAPGGVEYAPRRKKAAHGPRPSYFGNGNRPVAY